MPSYNFPIIKKIVKILSNNDYKNCPSVVGDPFHDFRPRNKPLSEDNHSRGGSSSTSFAKEARVRQAIALAVQGGALRGSIEGYGASQRQKDGRRRFRLGIAAYLV